MLKNIDVSKCTKLQRVCYTAFDSCENLESLDLSHCTELKEIGGYAFSNTENLTVRLPDSITEIAEGAFGNPDKCHNGNCQKPCKKVLVPNEEIKALVLAANYPKENIAIYSE